MTLTKSGLIGDENCITPLSAIVYDVEVLNVASGE